MRYLILSILFLIVFSVWSQDSLYRKKNLTIIDIEAFYSYYQQDGNQSAVTGGVGTEKLHVNNVGMNLGITLDTSHTIIFETFLDAISSASVDNIDFVKSSASEHDKHISVHLGYQFTTKKSPFEFGVKYLFGVESDYLSHGFNFWTSFGSRDLTRIMQ